MLYGCIWNNGGAEEDRTPDLCIANAALSQLSYSPIFDTMIVAVNKDITEEDTLYFVISKNNRHFTYI